MGYLGSVDFVEGRSFSKTTSLVLQRCLGCSSADGRHAIGEFLGTLRIQPEAFFRDIDGDWNGRPFLGEHVYKVVKAAGYEGTEHDLWTAVTGFPAPYPIKAPKAVKAKAPRAKKTAVVGGESKAKVKAARGKAIKAAWESRA